MLSFGTMNMQKLWQFCLLLAIGIYCNAVHAQLGSFSVQQNRDLMALRAQLRSDDLQPALNHIDELWVGLGSPFGHELAYYKMHIQRRMGQYQVADNTYRLTQQSNVSPSARQRQLHQLERGAQLVEVGSLTKARDVLTQLMQAETTPDSIKQLAAPVYLELLWQTGELQPESNRLKTMKAAKGDNDGCPSPMQTAGYAYTIRALMKTGRLAEVPEQIAAYRALHQSDTPCAVELDGLEGRLMAPTRGRFHLLTGQVPSQTFDIADLPTHYYHAQHVALLQSQVDIYRGDFKAAIERLRPLSRAQLSRFPMAHPIQAETYYWLGWAYYMQTGDLPAARNIWKKGLSLRIDWEVHTALQRRLRRLQESHPLFPQTAYETMHTGPKRDLADRLEALCQTPIAEQTSEELTATYRRVQTLQDRLLNVQQIDRWLVARIVQSPAYQEGLVELIEQLTIKFPKSDQAKLIYPLLENHSVLSHRQHRPWRNRLQQSGQASAAEARQQLETALLQTLTDSYTTEAVLAQAPLHATYKQTQRKAPQTIPLQFAPLTTQTETLPLNVARATLDDQTVHFYCIPLANKLALMAIAKSGTYFELKQNYRDIRKLVHLYGQQRRGELEERAALLPVRLYERLFFSFPVQFRNRGDTWHIHATGAFRGLDFPNLETELARTTNKGLLRFPLKSYYKVVVGQ